MEYIIPREVSFPKREDEEQRHKEVATDYV